MMRGVSRNPGESTEQWNARALAEYYAAWDALAERHRLVMTGIAEDTYPVEDEGYDRVMDRLETADCERGDASIAVNRERLNGDSADGMRADLDHRMTDEPSVDPARRPIYDDFRHGTIVDWPRFRDTATSWDAARARPGSVQDPFSNLPPGE
jgi:hypothetical protein